jgi:hypothetical protein
MSAIGDVHYSPMVDKKKPITPTIKVFYRHSVLPGNQLPAKCQVKKLAFPRILSSKIALRGLLARPPHFKTFPRHTRKDHTMSKLTKAEQEVQLSKCADEDHWTVYCTDPAELPYYLALARKVGGRVVDHQGGKKIFIPQDSVLLSVKRKLNLSPEQREERSRCMKERRACQRVTSTPLA